MDEKRFVELMENNNKVLAEMMDNKIQENNEVNNKVLAEIMDDKIQDNNNEILVQIGETISRIEKTINKRIDKLEEKIIDNGFYLEEKYGKKIDIIFEKLELNDQIKSEEDQELAKYKKRNDTLLMSHEVRITNLEEAVN